MCCKVLFLDYTIHPTAFKSSNKIIVHKESNSTIYFETSDGSCESSNYNRKKRGKGLSSEFLTLKHENKLNYTIEQKILFLSYSSFHLYQQLHNSKRGPPTV